ncbi:MAG: D-2-hydroxyacid dehydrogenase [Lachnospiraceae bacterium]
MKKSVIALIPCDENQKKALQGEFEQSYDFIFQNDYSEEEFMEKREALIHQADIIIGEPDLGEISRVKAPNLKWIQMSFAGTDKYTKNKGFPQNVILSNASGAFGVIIAEYIVAGVLNLYRRLSEYRDRQRKHLWQDVGSEEHLYGKRVLIMGTGNIGTQTAKRLKAFDCFVSGIRRKNILPEFFDEVHLPEELPGELSKADIVINCMPHNPESVGLMSREGFSKMKSNAIFVNVGRGSVLEEGALEWALREKKIAGAVLDVQPVEPLPEQSVLWNMENVIITPHIAGISFGHSRITEDKIWEIVWENLKRYDRGFPLINTVCMDEYR